MSLMLAVSARIRFGAGLIGESLLYQGWASVSELMAPNTPLWDSGSGNQCEGLGTPSVVMIALTQFASPAVSAAAVTDSGELVQCRIRTPAGLRGCWKDAGRLRTPFVGGRVSSARCVHYPEVRSDCGCRIRPTMSNRTPLTCGVPAREQCGLARFPGDNE